MISEMEVHVRPEQVLNIWILCFFIPDKYEK